MNDQSGKIIPPSDVIFQKLNYGPIRLFGYGNEKRDLTLLLRGDVEVPSPVDMGFFGCASCGFISFDKPFIRVHAHPEESVESYQCLQCGSVGLLWFEGVWRGTEAMPILPKERIHTRGPINKYNNGYEIKTLTGQWHRKK